MKKWMAILLALALLLSFSAVNAEEEVTVNSWNELVEATDNGCDKIYLGEKYKQEKDIKKLKELYLKDRTLTIITTSDFADLEGGIRIHGENAVLDIREALVIPHTEAPGLYVDGENFTVYAKQISAGSSKKNNCGQPALYATGSVEVHVDVLHGGECTSNKGVIGGEALYAGNGATVYASFAEGGYSFTMGAPALIVSGSSRVILDEDPLIMGGRHVSEETVPPILVSSGGTVEYSGYQMPGSIGRSFENKSVQKRSNPAADLWSLETLLWQGNSQVEVASKFKCSAVPAYPRALYAPSDELVTLICGEKKAAVFTQPVLVDGGSFLLEHINLTGGLTVYGGSITVNGDITLKKGTAIHAFGGTVTVNGKVTGDIVIGEGASVTVNGEEIKQ